MILFEFRKQNRKEIHSYGYYFPTLGYCGHNILLFFSVFQGESFDLMDGVLGMALSPYQHGRDRFLYFHALAATTENVVRTSVLRNDSFITDSNANPYSINVSTSFF